MTSDLTRSLLKGYVNEGLATWKDNDTVTGLDGESDFYLEQGNNEVHVYINDDQVDTIDYNAPDFPSRIATWASDALNF